MAMKLTNKLDEFESRAQSVVAEQNQLIPKKDDHDAKVKDKKRQTNFKTWIEVCKQYRRNLVKNWSINVDYRKGKPYASMSDDDQIAVNMDWALTKTKQAALFSQVPRAIVSHNPDSVGAGPWLAKFENKVNEKLVIGGIEATMDECMPDCINASGLGIALVSYESITEDKEVPSIDMSMLPPEIQAMALQTGKINGIDIPMETVPQTLDKRYVVQRISPSDFLWPLGFTGSDFDRAPWLGRSGRIPWAEAARKYDLKEEDRDKYIGENRNLLDNLTRDLDRERAGPEETVEFDEIFYWEHMYDAAAKSYSTIHHMVYLFGKTEPVVDEAWKGQKIDEQSGEVIGSRKTPLRVLTLSYVTDEPIPPSDSAIGRPQVNEINKSRTQVIKQRERNIPVRWVDINRVDPSITQSLMRGTWSHFIPVQGEGSRVIGEVAKSGHPVENPMFDQIAKNDLNEQWSIGPNQVGSGMGVETKGESTEIATNFQTRVGRDRAKVASFFVGIAEVMGGLICLYEDPSIFGEGFDPGFSKALEFSILADSTVLVDATQRLAKLNAFMNEYAKSGFVSIEPCLREIATLTGLDPNVAIKAPDPKPPVEPNISLRLTGTEDMMNPLTLAFLIKSGQAPPPELIDQAKQLIQQAVMMPQPQPPPSIDPMTGQPMPPPPGGVPPPGTPMPPGPQVPQAVGEANPNMTVLPKISKRSDDPGAGGKEPL